MSFDDAKLIYSLNLKSCDSTFLNCTSISWYFRSGGTVTVVQSNGVEFKNSFSLHLQLEAF